MAQILEGKAHLQVTEVGCHHVLYAGWHMEELFFHCLFMLGFLDLVPDHCCVLYAPWKAWDSCLLAVGVNVAILKQVGGHFGQH